MFIQLQRGLTSFLMAGLDDRVFAIAPLGQTQLVYEEVCC